MMRLVHLNEIEPAVISARTPAGFDCIIDILYRTQADTVWSADIAGTLVLTGRTTTRSTSYMIPTTDMVNGKARVVIPGGDLSDPNGYSMTLVGTYEGARKVLANGTLVLSDEGVPELALVDEIDTIDLVLDYNENCELDVTLWTDADGGTPYDLTDENTQVGASIYDVRGGTVLQQFAVDVTGENSVSITLTVDEVNSLPPDCWWSLVASQGGGVTTMAEGKVTVTGAVIPPLTPSTFNYDYSKPLTFADPVSGQIVHGTNTMNHLQVAKVDSDLTDRSATLALVRPGDTIQIGVTVWTVGAVQDSGGWYTFEVLPIQQAAPTGVTSVTFDRPV